MAGGAIDALRYQRQTSTAFPQMSVFSTWWLVTLRTR